MAPSTGSGAATGGTSGATGGATATSPGGGTTAGPSPARPAVQEFAANPNLKDINFDFDKYDIRPGDAKILDANATWLKGNNNLVLIEGHCDERGTNEYNLALGERRAKATMNYLVSQGVQAARITIISYGEERPLCTEKTEACWARNRRAHFLTKAR
jgi:peptidoglycan-associated lipoprotein